MVGKIELTYRPEDDGITHINVYSRGATELGQMLSHFYRSRFKHPYYGTFESMEGFWHYVKAEGSEDRERLRSLWGWEAKKAGKEFQSKWVEHFEDVIMSGNLVKIQQNPRIIEELAKSHLPFDHYYLMGRNGYPVKPAGYDWLMRGLEEIRDRVHNGTLMGTV